MENNLEEENMFYSHHSEKFIVEFKNLSYSVNEKKGRKIAEVPILKNINGRFESGHLIAILGPSGAGKTSFLNVLSGIRTSGMTGSIMLNEHERDVNEFRKVSCYIPQEFSMLPLLTTEETLLNAADLKLGNVIGKTKKTAMVNEILQILGLQKTKNTRVGNLSGGEKRRLSIGVELLVNPPVMFFDEPTSGLDSSSTMQVISHLKSMAAAGRIVVCSIHQPSSRIFEMFDDVYILTEGQCMYSGPVQDMAAVFKDEGLVCPIYYNRADFAIEVACNEKGSKEKLIMKYKNIEFTSGLEDNPVIEQTLTFNPRTKIKKETAITISSVNSPDAISVSAMLQFIILTKRSLLCTYRDLYMTKFRILLNLMVGLFTGFLCYNCGNDASKIPSNGGYIFFVVLFVYFLSPVLTLLIFPFEAPVFLREYQNNWYTLRAYFFSKLAAELPMQVICPTLFILGSYFLSDQPYDGTRLLKFWTLCMMLSVCGQSMGFAIGTAFSVQMGLFVLICTNLPMAMISGFLIRLCDMPNSLQWLTYVNYFHYAFEAAMICIYGENRPKLMCSEIYCHFKFPSKLFKEFGFSDSQYGFDIMMILLWIFIMQALFYCVLRWRIYTSR